MGEERTLRMLYFDSYTLDLSPLAEQPGERYREPKERFLNELLRAPQTASEEQHRDELLAEAHRRIVTPLNAMALAMIGLAAMIASPGALPVDLPISESRSRWVG